MTESHRERYPEQYKHHWVGKQVTFKLEHQGKAYRVTRVMSTQFGLLAELDGLSRDENGTPLAFALDNLNILSMEEEGQR